MSVLPTVRIKVDKTADNHDGVVIINESDFDEKIHVLYDEKAAESAGKESPSATAKEAEVKQPEPAKAQVPKV